MLPGERGRVSHTTPTRGGIPHRSLKWEVPHGRIGAWIAESDFGTAPCVTSALHEAVDDGLLTYLPERTAATATAAFTAFAARRYGWRVADERVHIVPDVLSALRAMLEHLSPPGAVVVPTPAYAPFLRIPIQLGRQVVQVPSRRDERGWHLDLDGIDRAFAAGASVLVLCHPHNPLGSVLDRAQMTEVAAVVEHHGGRVFADEIHAPIVYAPARHVPYASLSATTAAHTVTATAASKGWNVPGLKSAQMILTAADDHRRWARAEVFPRHLGSVLGAVAAAAAYSPEGERWLDDAVQRFRANRDWLEGALAERLPEIAPATGRSTYLAWLDLAPYGLADPSAFLSERAGVVTTPGSESGDGFAASVRFNFAMQPGLLHDAVDRIASALASEPVAVNSSHTRSLAVRESPA